MALRAPAGPLCCPGHAGRAVGRGRGWGVFASGWGWGCAAGVVAQKYRLFFLFALVWTRGEVRSAKIRNYEPMPNHWMNRRLEDVWLAKK